MSDADTVREASGSGHPDHSEELSALAGQRMGPPELARDPVNRSMIRHWIEAMGDANPIYTSDEAARAVGLPGVVAPPTMLQAWGMRGLAATLALEESRASGGPRNGGQTPNDRMMRLLDEEGLTSVVATNCEQHYDRPLALGERPVSSSVIESISDVKRTGLGEGRFVTTRVDFFALDDEPSLTQRDPEALLSRGDPVATMRFRILKFRPRPAGTASSSDPDSASQATRPRRPRPALTQDNAFFFEGARQHKLLIQRCTKCGTLRHPPAPACGSCRSFEWDTVEASGRGMLYSYVVVHYPQVPAFDYPLPIALVELEEGTRLVANVDGVAPDQLHIGMRLAADFVDFDEELSLPVFRPTAAAAMDSQGTAG